MIMSTHTLKKRESNHSSVQPRLAEIANTVWRNDCVHDEIVIRQFVESNFFNLMGTTDDLRRIIEGTDPYRRLTQDHIKFANLLSEISNYYKWFFDH